MKNKGQSILAIIMWGAGISIPFIAGSYYFVSSKFTAVNTDIKENSVDIAIVQQKTTDIDNRLLRIETKLDLIIERTKK